MLCHYFSLLSHASANLYHAMPQLIYTMPLPYFSWLLYTMPLLNRTRHYNAFTLPFYTVLYFASAMRFQAVQLLYVASRRITLLYYAFTELGSAFPLLYYSTLRHHISVQNYAITAQNKLNHTLHYRRVTSLFHCCTILRWKAL